jgi:hypothetical protein
MALGTACFTALILGIALWADGSGLGAIVVSAPIVGLAVFYSARESDRISAQLLVAFVYLGSVALAAVTSFLINKVYYDAQPTALLSEGLILSAIILGLTVCDAALRGRLSGVRSPIQRSLT